MRHYRTLVSRYLITPVTLVIVLAATASGADVPDLTPVDNLSAEQIIKAAYENAGGDTWVNPTSLKMEGYGYFWRGTEKFVRYEPYRMWRVYPTQKADAHAADGKVRIEAFADGEIVFQLAFDGETTYDQNGPLEIQADSDRWASNFGFGVIRHALDEGYRLTRLPDDYVDAEPAYVVQITDPTDGKTIFGIRTRDFAVVSVGFDTPRGWHERRYSAFFRTDEGGWLQPGRVRLYYDGVKANEIYWTNFTIGEDYPLSLFQLGD